jgi:hypothetical protein
MKNLFVTIGLLLSLNGLAGVEAFTTTSMQKLFIEEAPELPRMEFPLPGIKSLRKNHRALSSSMSIKRSLLRLM